MLDNENIIKLAFEPHVHSVSGIRFVCDCSSVRNFVEEFKKKEIPLNMLFNNAGEWMREDNTYTQEGFQAS